MYTLSDASLSYVIGIPTSIMVLMFLGLVLQQVFHAEHVHTGEVSGPYRPAHADDTVDDPIDVMHDDIETYVQVGRRGANSPIRNQPVPKDWRPYTGDLRIALLETNTAQWLFVRKPKDQLDTTRTQFVRAYAFQG